MKSKILVTVIVLITIGNLFPEKVNDFKKIQLSPFFYFEKKVISTIELKPEHHDFSNKIYTVDHISLGTKLHKSFFFTTFHTVFPWHDNDILPIYLDTNFGINYHIFSAYLGKVFSLKCADNEMIETFYYGVNSKYKHKNSSLLCDLQFVDGDYYEFYEGKESFNVIALNLQFNYSFKKIFPYGLFSLSKWDFDDDLQYQLSLGISLINPPAIKNNIAPAIYNNPNSVHVDKPNIYLYPENECEVKVCIKPNGKITESIPAYNDGWKVHVAPTGIIDNEYTFLFYEAEVTVKTPEFGWCIAVNELNSFFERVLTNYSLNNIEIKDFIEYWLDRLDESSYYCIYPLVNDDITNFCPISIDPKPDNLLRLWFVFTPAEKYRILIEPDIPAFSRSGFEVVEWGGILQK